MSEPGTSLLVPSVQELAKQHIAEVPKQYLHLNQDPINVVSNTTSSTQVPIVDLKKLLSQDATELQKLHSACKEWGFFQLISHGVNLSLVENVKKGVQDFLSLPMEERKKLWQTPEDIEGFGQAFVVSEDQKLEWADVFFTTTLPSHARNPRLFPNIPQPLRDNLETYALELERIFITIINHMEKALEIESNEVLKLFDDVSQITRWNYYPPCPQPENVIGLNPHSDVDALTILLQVNEIEGLQIRKDGKWIPIKPLPNAFIINVGDILEILTNGIYQSIEHRATINSSEKARISIATFHRPLMNKVIGPTPSLVTPERPALFKSIVVEDYYRAFFLRKLQGKSLLDVIRIENGTD
ncbi:protein SRG1-like [Lotus japonicus]|uniref:protein SRG1-like n=1 Tax=Lotus japonicus TaxID=34305 RepID=UPI0025852C3E|nr:protein SRG1-like [Lotus japonicus]XP_057448039.1 protein SRG1-like [Lotus japonicus]